MHKLISSNLHCIGILAEVSEADISQLKLSSWPDTTMGKWENVFLFYFILDELILYWQWPFWRIYPSGLGKEISSHMLLAQLSGGMQFPLGLQYIYIIQQQLL